MNILTSNNNCMRYGKYLKNDMLWVLLIFDHNSLVVVLVLLIFDYFSLVQLDVFSHK